MYGIARNLPILEQNFVVLEFGPAIWNHSLKCGLILSSAEQCSISFMHY